MKRILERVKKPGLLRGDESGQVLVLVAIAAVFLIGMVALAVDVSHGLVVRHELQNAADASSLAGAGNLFKTPPGPNWSGAETAASSSITWNKSDGQSLFDCQVESGYWNLSLSPAGLQPQDITPGTQDVPAVKVQVRRTSGENGGPVSTWFARIFGINSFPVQAQAIAVVSYPGVANPGALIPVAISEEFAENRLTHRDATNPIDLFSVYHSPDGDATAGQWTTFLQVLNNVPAIQGLIANGNPDPVNIGDRIWIQPGTETRLYTDIRVFVGQEVLLPVVDGVLRDRTHDWATVTGFVGFHILSVQGPPTRTITGYFVEGFVAGNTGGSGPNYGAITPPHLVL